MAEEWMRGNINCEKKCEIPDRAELHDIPEPRHAWSGIVVCPHEGCRRAFMVRAIKEGT